jgi:hypothetical protein
MSELQSIILVICLVNIFVTKTKKKYKHLIYNYIK